VLAQHDIGYLQALGIVVYQLRSEIPAAAVPEFTSVLGQPHADRAPAVDVRQRADSANTAFADAQNALRVFEPEIAPRAVAAPIAAPRPVAKRSADAPELVVPAAELARFAPSKLCLHLGLAIFGKAIPAVENSVQSETALWFESPNGQLKLGSLSLLRTSWRARRQAWVLLRAWRKQNPR
jgi:hypothetical protein